MSLLNWVYVQCPYCDVSLEISLEPGNEAAMYIEDCQVCCQPIVMRPSLDPVSGETSVSAHREDDA
ncbi:MAG: CPXCG motif-containing cysteine-rich protein [Chromatiales bacterium]|jgi:hypothetical protein|nr:CPXCG motif-containing cysteine-rich protein [Chromatiales bacterium]